MTSQRRIQLTLFIDESDAEAIERVRREFNPKQFELIQAHVTLCREDELEPLERVLDNLAKLKMDCVAVDFESVVRFSNGNGVLIPAKGDNERFQALRANVLKGVVDNPRKHQPHITLMHPRNSNCTDEIFEQIAKTMLPTRIEFKRISLIEQEIGRKWKVVKEFELIRRSEVCE